MKHEPRYGHGILVSGYPVLTSVNWPWMSYVKDVDFPRHPWDIPPFLLIVSPTPPVQSVDAYVCTKRKEVDRIPWVWDSHAREPRYKVTARDSWIIFSNYSPKANLILLNNYSTIFTEPEVNNSFSIFTRGNLNRIRKETIKKLLVWLTGGGDNIICRWFYLMFKLNGLNVFRKRLIGFSLGNDCKSLIKS